MNIDNIKYYYQVEKYNCLQSCLFENCKIGSITCQECKQNIAFNVNENWVICEKRLKTIEENNKSLKDSKIMEVTKINGKLYDIIPEVIKGTCENCCFRRGRCTHPGGPCLKPHIYRPHGEPGIKENIIIDIPKGFTPELKDGKITLVYTDTPLNNIPKSWEGLGMITGEFITAQSGITNINNPVFAITPNQNVISSGLGKPMLAFIKLLQLRNRTWEITDSKPKWKGETVYVLKYNALYDTVTTEQNIRAIHSPISFSNPEVTNKFLEYHKDLLYEAREFL